MDIASVDMQSQRYRRELEKKKRALAPTEFGWYAYGTLNPATAQGDERAFCYVRSRYV